MDALYVGSYFPPFFNPLSAHQMFNMKKKSVKQPYEGYTLPKSSEKGQPFVDFNEVLKEIIPRKVKIRRKKKNER